MKFLSQIIALYLPAAESLQVMTTIGSVILILKILANKLTEPLRKWKMKQRTRDLENDMWAIE